MNSNYNPFYEAASNLMHTQLIYLEKAVGRELTADEKDNIYEFYSELDSNIKSNFEDEFGALL